jgi:hypothetical protein
LQAADLEGCTVYGSSGLFMVLLQHFSEVTEEITANFSLYIRSSHRDSGLELPKSLAETDDRCFIKKAVG